MASCTAVVGFILLLACVVLAGVSLGTPYWLRSAENATTPYHAGLWQQCMGEDNNNCNVFYGNGTGPYPAWFNTSRILMCLVTANCLVALLVSMGYMCCTCCYNSVKAVQFVVIVLVVACVELVIVVSVFTLKSEDNSFIEYKAETVLGWSVAVAIAAGAAILLDILLFVCETSSSRRRVDYQPITPTNFA